jgi:DNA-binding winged helix-turn-helix (wHTH) protein/TolB-like protein
VHDASHGPHGSYAFGRFQLSADGTLLVRDGERVALAPKVLQTLLVLVERAGQVVRKTDLLARVWPDSFVEETGLSRNVSLLRQALGDEARAIVTVARIGYRFAAPVTRLTAPTRPAPADAEPLTIVDADTDTSSERPKAKNGDRKRLDASHRSAGLDAAIDPPEPGALTRLLILPFRQLHDDPDTNFLAFSLPDAVIHALSGLTSLVVRSSAMASRFGRDPVELSEIATHAVVDAILTGTLLRSGQRIRVSVQLLRVPCGTVLLSESVDVMQSELFELQDRLVEQIVRSLSLSLTAHERRRLKNDVPASPRAYEFFLRGNESVGPQGISRSSDLRIARELYQCAIEEDPRFAPAWVRLGRCHYLIGKSSDSPEPAFRLAESCFERALTLSPDLPIAQNLYALFEIDRGLAKSAMVRLVARGLAGSAQPELFAALVQACRFCGLLEPSIVAHHRARQLDSTIATGGYLAHWQLGDEEGARRESVSLCWIIDAMIFGMRGNPERALEILREDRGLTGVARNMVTGLRAVIEGRQQDALESAMPIFEAFPDPEMVYFTTRTLAVFGDRRALDELQRSLEHGFVLYRALLREDPWLDPIRATPAFQRLIERSRDMYRDCRQAYLDAGGERLLGPVPSPEDLEAEPRIGDTLRRYQPLALTRAHTVS